MIAFVIGTTAELIKINPVRTRILERRNHVELWSAAQQPTDLQQTSLDFGVAIDLLLSDRTENLEARRQVPRWASSVLGRVVRQRSELRGRLRSDGMPPLLIVHGDTMTSVLGAMAGRILGVPVCHIEAGLRSGDIRNPFPEELDRRLVAKLATLHFAPDDVAVGNLSSTRGRVVNTHGNTGLDSLQEFRVTKTSEKRILVSLHRSELLAQSELLRSTVHTIARLSEFVDVTMIVDSLTRAALSTQDLTGELDHSRVTVVPKLRYREFISLLNSASAVVTDSGGLQEECAALGKPCLVYREKTERQDGLGDNARLSGLDPDAIMAFARTYHSLERPGRGNLLSPSSIVVAELVSSGYIR